MKVTALILAGGLGTRLSTVVNDRPKPMALINNRPFLAHQLDYWINQGVARFILSVGYKHQLIVSYFGNCYKGIPLDYVIEPQPLGTGGALIFAIKKIMNSNSHFLLLNGDTYFAVELKQLIDFSHKNNADYCFSLFHTSNFERYMGLAVDAQGQIASLNVEKKQQQKRYLANGGVYWVKTDALLDYVKTDSNAPISLEQDIFPNALVSNKRLFGIEFTSTFIDIGIPDDYFRAGKLACMAI